jgi:hypothetical protein
MRLVISGTREEDDLVEFETLMAIEHVVTVFKRHDEDLTAVITGGARGVDTYAEKWAKARGIKVLSIAAQWDRFGKSAGARRNTELFKVDPPPTFFLGIPGPNSKGTWDAAKKAMAAHIPGIVWPRLLDDD